MTIEERWVPVYVSLSLLPFIGLNQLVRTACPLTVDLHAYTMHGKGREGTMVITSPQILILSLDYNRLVCIYNIVYIIYNRHTVK